VLQAIGRRVASTVITLLGVSILIFVILRLLPGNAVTAQLGTSAGLLTKAQLAALDRFYGIGQNPVHQYLDWLGATLTGNLGVSLSSRVPVSSLVWPAFRVTLELAVVTTIMSLVFGVGLGVAGARRQGRVVDGIGQGVAIFGLGVPSFVIGSGLIAFLAAQFHYFPDSQTFASLLTNPWLNLQQMFWPALALTFGIAAALMRTSRTAVLEVSSLNYVRTARGKGLARRAVTWKHIFLNSLVPIITMTGIQLGYLLGGTVIIEELFILPGLGRLLVSSVNDKDYPVVQSVVLIFAACFVVVNMLVDVAYTIIDPRLRSR
jgi:peptide/nickel transport system permease protein